MPNRGQTQDPGQRGRNNPGTVTPDDDETVRNEDSQRQAQPRDAQQAGRNQRDLPEDEGADIESDDEAGSDDDEVTGVSQ